LASITGLAVDHLDAAVAALVETELIYETSAYPEPEYAFKHALVEEVAYGSQLAQRRTSVHASAARALAELSADRLGERASLIAHHYELGGEPLEAARWNDRAAVWAGATHMVEAARHWRRVRTLTEDLGPSEDADALAMQARCQLIGWLLRIGAAGEEHGVRWEDEARQIFAETDARALAAGQPHLRALVRAVYGCSQMQSDQLTDGYETSRAATRLADETGDPVVRSMARAILEWGLFLLGRLPEALAVAQQLEAIIGEDRSFARGGMIVSPYAYCQLHVAQFGGHGGRLDVGLRALERVVEIAGEEGDGEVEAWAHRNWVVFADWAGADPAAISVHTAAALNLGDMSGGPWSRIYVREGVAAGHAQRGEWDRALAVVDEALAIVRGRRLGYTSVPLLLSLRARAQLGHDDVGGARSTAAAAVESALTIGTRFYEAQARHQLGRAILASGDQHAAADELERALSIVEDLGISAYAPQVEVDLAYTKAALGDHTGCEAALSRALRRFEGIGAVGHARRVQAELSAKRVR